MDIFRLHKTYKSARRLRQIIRVFLGHGFGSVIDQLQLGRYIPFRKRLKSFGHWPSDKSPTSPERLRIAFGELGPSFIKLGQLLSSRPDLVTPRFAAEFKKLQDDVPPFAVSEVRRTLMEDFGRSAEELFLEFEEVPVAAASIAQVHNARLRSGADVIVKVQRPGIKEALEEDIDIMSSLARLLERNIAESRFFNPSGIVADFSRSVKKELDFIAESRNCMHFKRSLADFPDIHIPTVETEFLSARVIVMERIDGVRIDDIKSIEALGLNRTALSHTLINAYLHMILVDGFFHGDPHPGNIFVTDEGMICLMDFGIVGRVGDGTKELMANIFLALINKDFGSMIDCFIDLGHLPEDTNPDVFKKEFMFDLTELLEPVYEMSINQINFAETLDIVFQVAMKHRLVIPNDLIMVNKTILILEGLVRVLDPEFNLISATEPYAKKLIRLKFSPFEALKRQSKAISEAGDVILMMPHEIKKLFRRINRDDIGIKINIGEFGQFIRDMDRSSNRIAFALVTSAIIMSSSIMFSNRIGPSFMGLPILGSVGFGFAFILGIWLIISIIRSGRL